ncbi:MAG: LUD domain-containing protein [Betaproteobacteria bacterium]
MSARDDILARIHRNQPAARALPAEIPAYDAGLSNSIEAFKSALLRMGGKFALPMAPADGNLDAQIAKLFPDARVICSATPEAKGNRPIGTVRAPQELDDVDVGVVRARFGVAETGSLWLSESELKVNALAFLAQHLVALLDPDAIVTNIHRAYQHRGFFEAQYAVLMTGPSATADIEGILIHGAQGIRTLTVIPLPAIGERAP